ncbi:lysophospholiPASe L1 [Terrimicrobium sacchariphilum]|uniref:LysophospholiPASe L1 n=1 Tax=Terrimicrobium sacchariphilum TaxID=690879 RepID=A0A146G4J4_TERSA|nr:SGNH/GDSL hydrolase family protein [Terrimicrobium sacchariphilum]GAT32550.1 lysophospholiPASe L1 [Terrimicrobium sacchariphilum]
MSILHRERRTLPIGCALAVLLLALRPGIAGEAEAGADVARVFAAARAGAPLRYVALGGSITQSGEGWIGPWLTEKFPSSRVTTVNSGMSATGSALGVFRIERDVIAHQPDLVAIETCVNDDSLPDDVAIRYLESLVVRLRQLPHPPAIIFLEAAAKQGSRIQRHRQVARHYGLLEVDLQAAIDAELKRTGQDWTAFFSDAVHPNEAGNRFYARTIEQTLAPLLDKKPVDGRSVLPHPISEKPLILDGRMVPLFGITGVPGWRKNASPPFWMDAFFNGTLSASEPGAALEIPFRGTWAGVFYPMDKGYGTFDASIDGGAPLRVAPNTRGGYSLDIVGRDLPAGEHVLRITLPAPDSTPGVNGEVRLGYLLVAGEGTQ